MLRALGISRIAYLYHKKTEVIDNKKEIEQAIIICFKKYNGKYGRPRKKKELEKQGIIVSEGKVGKILKQNNLIAKAGRRRKNIKRKVSSDEQIRLNLLIKKDLTALKPYEALVSDITEINIKKGRIYLAAVMETHSRYIIGYRLSTNMRQDIVIHSIKMGINKFKNTKGIIFHSDRGSQYTSNDVKKLLLENEMLQSMSRAGTPSDNQLIESFWNTLKTEMGSLKEKDRKESYKAIIEYIRYYNT